MLKHSSFILFLLGITFGNLFGQISSQGNNNFKQIQQTFYQNYTGSGGDSTEAGNFRQFKRWEMFWGPRLTGHNNFDTAIARHKFFLETFDPIDFNGQSEISNWQELGPRESGHGGIGRIDAIAFHPSDINTLYVGCPSGGVWVSYNQGQNWQNLNTDHQLPSLGVSSIAVDPAIPEIIFLGTGDVDSEYTYSSGIYRSLDAGLNWEIAGLNDLEVHFTIAKILLHPSDNTVAFAATSLGIYKTTNRNHLSPLWQKVYPSAPEDFEYVRNIDFHPFDPLILYACGIDIISSSDNGNINSWDRIATSQNGLDFENTPWPNAFEGEEYVISLNMAIAPQGDFLYVNCVNRETEPPFNWQSATFYHIFRYDILNDVWDELSIAGLIGGPRGYGLTAGRSEMAVSPLDSRRLYCAGVWLYVFNPDLLVIPWKRVNFESHLDFHELAFSPHELNVMYAGTDGGLYKKNLSLLPHFILSDGPSEVSSRKKEMSQITREHPTIELNDGLGISMIYNFGSSKLDPYQILMGFQDCGINYLKNGNWYSQKNPSDGFQCLMDDNDIDLMYYTIYSPSNGSLYRSLNNCFDPTWENILNAQAPIYEQTWFGASLVTDPFNSKTLLQARINLWKVDDASTATIYDWYKITDVNALTSNLWGDNNCVVFALEIAPSNPDYIYFTGVKVDSWVTNFDANRVFKTTLGGGTSASDWTEITPRTPDNPLGTYFVTDLAVSSWNPEKIWISYGGYLEDYKVKYFDGSTWTDFNDGLENIPVHCIAYVNGSNDALFAGTDVGVYYRDASMQEWKPFMSNLPNVKISWLEINYTNQKLRAGTFGRGLWESDIPIITKIENDNAMYSNNGIELIPIKVFPNPVDDDRLTIEFEDFNDHLLINGIHQLDLAVVNSVGERIYKETVNLYTNTASLSTSGWAPGLYQAIIFESGKLIGECKFVVK